jgi:hypothetical protein
LQWLSVGAHVEFGLLTPVDNTFEKLQRSFIFFFNYNIRLLCGYLSTQPKWYEGYMKRSLNDLLHPESLVNSSNNNSQTSKSSQVKHIPSFPNHNEPIFISLIDVIESSDSDAHLVKKTLFLF